MSDVTQLRLALDPVAFARHVVDDIDALDAWQVKFLRSTERRMLVNVHRQGGKSAMTAVLTLRQALYHPGSLVLILAPALRQAQEFFDKVSSYHKRLTGEGLIAPAESDRKLGLVLANGSRVECLPGTPRTIRGFSAPALVVVDEASQIDDELFTVILPMLLVSKEGGRLLMLSTPFGQRGIFWQLWSEGEDYWTRIEVPVTAVPRIGPARIEEARRTFPDWKFRQEMLCSFEANAASVFDYATLQAALSDDFPPLFANDDEEEW